MNDDEEFEASAVGAIHEVVPVAKSFGVELAGSFGVLD